MKVDLRYLDIHVTSESVVINASLADDEEGDTFTGDTIELSLEDAADLLDTLRQVEGSIRANLALAGRCVAGGCRL